MKYTIVGDIHGKVEVVEHALSMEGQVIFVGDFMDSSNRSPEDHRKCLRLVLDAITAGKARAIYGNHELSYLISRHRCSGFQRMHSAIMVDMQDEIAERFESHILLAPDFLVTHAGLTNQIWEQFKLSREILDAQLCEWWKDHESPMHWIGQSRGGYEPVGGTFWCDFNAEFQPVPGLKQVFGHTRRGGKNGIRRIEDSYCIDCLDSPQHAHTFMEAEL